MITMGIRMSLGLFVQPWDNDTNMSISQISFALAVCQLMWGVSQPLTGAVADRFGAYPVLLWGTLLFAMGMVLMPWLPYTWGLTLTVGMMLAIGAGAGSHSILMSLVANRVSPTMRGTASGVVNAGGSFGQFLFAPLVQGLIGLSTIGWRGAMYVLASIALLIIPLSRILIIGNKQQAHSTVSLSHHNLEPQQTLGQAVKQASRNGSYWLLHAGFFTCGFHIAFLVTHLPTEVALCGLPPSVASWSLALIGMANVVGSLVVG